MKEYKKKHPLCEFTNTRKDVQVHHIVPVWACPERAADKTNMISLSTSANIHLLFGHNGNFHNRYVANIKDIAESVRGTIGKSEVVRRVETQSIKGKNRIAGWIVDFLLWWLDV